MDPQKTYTYDDAEDIMAAFRACYAPRPCRHHHMNQNAIPWRKKLLAIASLAASLGLIIFLSTKGLM